MEQADPRARDPDELNGGQARALMKTIGLIGGVTWESTAEYYKIINGEVARTLGGAHSARLVLVSLNFEDLLSRSAAGDDQGHRALYCDAARRLERAGADVIVICSNTGHRRAGDIRESVSIPVLHIADVVGSAIAASGARRVGLIGTAATMEDTFIRGALEQTWCLDVTVPDRPARTQIDELIKTEMARGKFSEHARNIVIAAIDRLVREQKIEAVVLGCTELPLLLRDARLACPSFDTLRLHATAAAQYALSDRWPRPSRTCSPADAAARQ